MCLQWCHVTQQLIDNDIPCSHCALRVVSETHTCATCTHARGTICSLTRSELPLVRRCCHWNATLQRGLRMVDIFDLAPGLLVRYGVDTVTELFAASDTAPDVGIGQGFVLVFLNELALPEVYGIPADEWDVALGRPDFSALWQQSPHRSE